MLNVGIYGIFITVAIFISNQIFKSQFQLSKELERKIGHIGFGSIALSAPFVFGEKWQFIAVIIYLLIWFYLIRKLTIFRGGLYDVVHLSSRPTIGDLLFPLSVVGLWLLMSPSDVSYYIVSILVMSLADSGASLIGKLYPYGMYKVAKSTKSLSGSFVFFVITIIIFTFFKESIPLTGSQFVFLAIATTVAEAISGYGLDNMTIPLVLYAGFHMF
ncbi:MAG: hypothetical protein ACRCV7_00155 [Culicoidibacterales bacterium]